MGPTTCRHLIASTGTLPLVGLVASLAAVAVQNPDAELLAQGERFLELERQIAAAYAACGSHPAQDLGREAGLAAEEVTDRAVTLFQDVQSVILDRMYARVRSDAWRALDASPDAAGLSTPDGERGGEPDSYNDQQLAWLLVRDLVDGEAV